MLFLLLQSARPTQWIKNLLVYAAFLFTLAHVPVAEAFLRASAAFVLFCFLSAAAYIINDLHDAEQDALHPRKQTRPIAGGRVPVKLAWAVALALAALGVLGSFLLQPTFGVLALIYFGITLAYSLALKYQVLLDVLALASGYVLRAVAGAEAIGVPTSFWLAFCTLLLALFLGLCKRRSELTGLGDEAVNHRAILGEYTVPLLDQMISVVTASALLAYALYTYFTPTFGTADAYWRFSNHLLAFTIPFVVYGIYRYLYLVYRHELGDAPEVLFLKDRPLQLCLVLWVAASMLAVVFGPSLGG